MPLYFEQAPTASLADWVECGWFFQSSTAVAGHRVSPDGCLDIIYERRFGLRAIGAMTREQRFDFPAGAYVAGIRFRPARAGPFLAIAPSQLTDRSAPLEDISLRWTRDLIRQLDDAVSIRDAMRLLLGNLPEPGRAPSPLQQAIGTLTAAHGDVDLDRTACQANLSSRQFRRRCLEETGLTPKLLCRVLRFRHACRIARASLRPHWSTIALESRYFDQSHFIRDFHHFTGLTPMAVFSNTRALRPD